MTPEDDLRRQLGRIVYVRWGARRNRADDVARALGAELVCLRWQTRRLALVPVRYLTQFFQTWWHLAARRPDVVVSQHTHPFCTAASYAYARLSGAVCVADNHNGPFVEARWQIPPLRVLNRFLWSRVLNLVHNEGIRHHVTVDQGIDGRFVVLTDPIPKLSITRNAPLESAGKPRILVIMSYSADEPVEEALRAAQSLPHVRFLFTGDSDRAPAAVRTLAGPNVTFTGFLGDDEYDQLLATCHGVMALSTRRYVLTRSCQEAIAAAAPLVHSDNPVAREYLAGGTVFVANTAEGIAGGVRELLESETRLRDEMAALREKKTTEWGEQLHELMNTIASARREGSRRRRAAG